MTSIDHLVSVVIPTFNQAAYLAEAIDSVLDQEYGRIELIVVNDGSTDATTEVLDRYRDRLLRIDQVNHGAAHALNQGIQAAQGELVCWLSSDDSFLPGKIAHQVEAFRSDPELGICFTGFETIDASGRFLDDRSDLAWVHPDLFVAVFWRNPINGSTVMMPRRVFDGVGLFDESLRADVDGDMWLRVAARYRGRHIPGAFLRYRIHGASLSADRGLMIASKTDVRMRRVTDGSLVRRLQAADKERVAGTLAAMSLDFGRIGSPGLARALLIASLRSGVDPIPQWTAAVPVLRVAIKRTPRRTARRLTVRRLAVAAARAVIPRQVRRLLRRSWERAG